MGSRHSAVISRHQSSSSVISRHHPSSVVIIRHQSSSVVIIRHHPSSVVISRHQPSSSVIIRHQWPSCAIHLSHLDGLNHPSSVVTSGHHVQSIYRTWTALGCSAISIASSPIRTCTCDERAHQGSSSLIRAHQATPQSAIAPATPAASLEDTRRSSVVIRGHQGSSGLIMQLPLRGHSEVIRAHQAQSGPHLRRQLPLAIPSTLLRLPDRNLNRLLTLQLWLD